MRRRDFLFALGAAAAGGALWLRPAEDGAPHEPYFHALNDLLRAQGPGRPVLLVDLDRVERNAARLRGSIAAGKQLRIVAKSLPSVALLREVMRATGTTRLMSFHQPFLNALATAMPDSDLLLGKPMPVRAAETFYHSLGATAFAPSTQLQWLIDTRERLAQYGQLARTLGTRMRVNLEIDVGLHRGGLSNPEQLDALLDAIAADSEHLAFAGFMGYDAHVGKVPGLIESRSDSLARANASYRTFIDRARARYPALLPPAPVFNGAGSPTFRLHDEHSPLNEVAVGSALVKPGDFDLVLLADFEPAAFIATPVLKTLEGLHLPGSDLPGDLWSLWDRNRRRSHFIYGGKWLADFISPAGLRENALYGSSSNQAIVNASPRVQLVVDDYVFLRPRQSEAVFLQFGDIVALRGGKIAGHYTVLPSSTA